MVYLSESAKLDLHSVVVCNESCEALFGCSKKSAEFWTAAWSSEAVIYLDASGGIIIIIIIIEEEEGLGHAKAAPKSMTCTGPSGCRWLTDWLPTYIPLLIHHECRDLSRNVDDWMNEWCARWRRRGIWRRRRRKSVVSKMRPRQSSQQCLRILILAFSSTAGTVRYLQHNNTDLLLPEH